MHIFNYLYQHIGDNIQIHTNGCDICIHDARKFANTLANSEEWLGEKTIIYNTCSVFAEREVENKLIINLLRKAFPDYKMHILGCDVNNNPQNYKNCTTYTIQDVNDIIYYEPVPDVVETEEPLIYVKVQDGCPHRCSYCIINKLRPDVFSIPYDTVVQIIKDQIKGKTNPRVELAGTELTEYYDEEHGYTLIELLEHLIEDVPEVERFSLTSLDPQPAMTEFVIEFIGEHKEKFIPHITLAVQSGSDKILRKMNRRHNSTRIGTLHELAEDYGVSLGWDIIVGFPGETEEDFQATFDLMRFHQPLSHTIFAFSPREGTPAYNLPDQVPEKEKQRRLKILTDYMDKTIENQHNYNFYAFAEYSEELTRYNQLLYIKDKVLHLLDEGTNEDIYTDLSNVDEIAHIITHVNDNSVIYVEFNPEKALENEIYINFFKEFIPSVPVIVQFPKDYKEDLNKFAKVYHCLTTRLVQWTDM